MKCIHITDKLYDQLEALSNEQDELIEVLACVYLERGMGELDRIEAKIEEIKAHTEFYNAAAECAQLSRRRH